RERLPARCPGMGLHIDAEDADAAERDVWLLPSGLPLQGRDVHPGRELEDLPEEEPEDRIQVHLLAPRPDHDARVDLVPQPRWPVLQHQSTGLPLQRWLNQRFNAGGWPHRRPPSRTEVGNEMSVMHSDG